MMGRSGAGRGLVCSLVVLAALLSGGCSAVAEQPPENSGGPMQGADVTDYRGNLARTGLLPGPGISGQPIELWRLQASVPLNYPPAVSAGVALIPDGAGVAAVDLRTGRRSWTIELGSVVGSPMTVSGKTLLVVGADRILRAVDLEARSQRWQLNGVAVGAQPSVVGSVVYVGTTDRSLAALDLSTGKRLWSVPVGHGCTKNAIVDDVAYVGSDSGSEVTAIDLAMRKIRWHRDVGSDRVATPVVGDGIAYLAGISGGSGVNRGDRLLAVDASTGRVKWRFRPPEDVPLASFALADSDIVIGADSPAGDLYRVDGDTGSVLWHVRNPGAIDRPVVVDGLLYVGTGRGGLNIYEFQSGALVGHADVDGYAEGVVVTGGVALVVARAPADAPGSITAFTSAS